MTRDQALLLIEPRVSANFAGPSSYVSKVSQSIIDALAGLDLLQLEPARQITTNSAVELFVRMTRDPTATRELRAALKPFGIAFTIRKNGASMSRNIDTAFRAVNKKLGSRHRKAWATKVKTKHGKYRKIGRLSHAAPQNRVGR